MTAKDRVFYVCKSKHPKCPLDRSEKHGTAQCTFSIDRKFKGLLNMANRCLLFDTEIYATFKPDWHESPQKPGDRNRMQNKKKIIDDLKNDPDYLEI